MSSAFDRPHAASFGHATRTKPRPDARPASRFEHFELPRESDLETLGAPPAVETVTLGKIGDFLELDFRRLFVWIRARLLTIVLLGLVGAAAGGAYAVLSPPKYTVDTEILIDPANLQVVSDDLYQVPGQVDGQLLDAASKMRILTSGNVLSRVVDDLDLAHDPEFVGTPSGFSLASLLGGADKQARDPRLAALAALSKDVDVKADQKSYVATLMVSAQSADRAIVLSGAIVRGFKDELARAEADGAARAASALDSRLTALKQDVSAAERKVEAYKRDNNLASSAGELVSTQTMTQLNTQVVEAQSRLIAAQSAYNELVAAGRNAATADSQQSAALVAVRAKVADLRQQYDSQSMVYGPRHPEIAKLQSQLKAAEAELDAEISRIVGAARVSVDEAKASLDALTARSDALTSSVFTDNEAMVTLRELQRDADSKPAIYEAFLTRAQQITQREQIDTSNVRVISTAVPPAARSWPPRTVLVMAGGAFSGIALGVMLAIGLGIAGDMRRDRVEVRRRAA
jgi:uncharacterized protein involved in exopolysaccharide biosynthesis